MRALWQALFADLRVAKVLFFQGFALHGTCIRPTWARAVHCGQQRRCAANAAILVAKSALSACSDSNAARAQLKPRPAIGRERRATAAQAADNRRDRDVGRNPGFQGSSSRVAWMAMMAQSGERSSPATAGIRRRNGRSTGSHKLV